LSFTNVLYSAECKRGVCYKAKQKGNHYGGNIKYGSVFYENHKTIKEKQLRQFILYDLYILFEELKIAQSTQNF